MLDIIILLDILARLKPSNNNHLSLHEKNIIKKNTKIWEIRLKSIC